MKVNIVSGPFISTKMLVRLTSDDPVKDPVLVKITTMAELTKKVKETGTTKINVVGSVCIFREGHR